MKSIYRLAAVIVVSMSIFQSCSKEQSLETGGRGTGTTTGTTDDSTLLVRFVSLDTTLPAPLDTLQYYNFSYDAAKRLTLLVYNEPNLGGLRQDIALFYNGSDSLPYKASIITFDPGSTPVLDTSIQFYTWSPAGQMLKDSETFNPYPFPGSVTAYASVYNYQYPTGNKVVHYRYDYFPGQPGYLSDSTTGTKTIVNGNIINEVDSIYYPGSNYVSYGKYVAQFDNHVNPLARVPFILRWNPTRDHDEALPISSQLNNMISETIYEGNTQPGAALDSFGHQGNFIYKPNGYPASATIRYFVNNASDIYKVVYIYGK